MKKLIVAAVAGGLIALAGAGVAHADDSVADSPWYTLGYDEMIDSGKEGYRTLQEYGVPQIFSDYPDMCDDLVQAKVAGMALGTREWEEIDATEYVAGCAAAVQELIAQGYAQ